MADWTDVPGEEPSERKSCGWICALLDDLPLPETQRDVEVPMCQLALNSRTAAGNAIQLQLMISFDALSQRRVV